MSQFSGPQGPTKKHGKNKGVMRLRRVQKRTEAFNRQERYARLQPHIRPEKPALNPDMMLKEDER